MAKCLKCESENPENSKFCSGCGQPLQAPGDKPASGISVDDTVMNRSALTSVNVNIPATLPVSAPAGPTEAVHCGVCGRRLHNPEWRCPECQEFVCEEHYNADEFMCLKCARRKGGNATVETTSQVAEARQGHEEQSVEAQSAGDESALNIGKVDFCPRCGRQLDDEKFVCVRCGEGPLCMRHWSDEWACCDQCAATLEDERRQECRRKAEEYFTRGKAAYEGDNCDLAIAEFTGAIEVDPTFAEAYYERGLAYLTGPEDSGRAIDDLTRAIEIEPNMGAAYRRRGIAYFREDDDKHALADLDHAVALGPEDARNYYWRSRCHYFAENHRLALDDADRAVQLEATRHDYFLQRANCLFAAERFDDAFEDLDHAVQLAPDDADTRSQRAGWYHNHERYDEALEDWDRAIELAEDDQDKADYCYGRAETRFELDDYDEALEDYTQAIELDPTCARAYHSRGWIYEHKKGDYERAAADYKRRAELEPNCDNYWTLGWCYEQMGELYRAYQAYTTGAEVETDPNEAKHCAFCAKEAYDKWQNE